MRLLLTRTLYHFDIITADIIVVHISISHKYRKISNDSLYIGHWNWLFRDLAMYRIGKLSLGGETVHLKIDLRLRGSVILVDKLTALCQSLYGDYRGFPCELYFTNFLDYRHEKPLKWPPIRLTFESSGSAQEAQWIILPRLSRTTFLAFLEEISRKR